MIQYNLPVAFEQAFNTERYPSGYKGTDSKSVRRREACEGSNPSLSVHKSATFLGRIFVLRKERGRRQTRTSPRPFLHTYAYESEYDVEKKEGVV
jgi:hypothetical protein